MGTSLLGTMVQARGAAQAAEGQRAAYQYNAQVGEMQAQDALSRGEQAVVRHNLQVKQLKGRQIANLAANGVDVTSGSALDILAGTDIMADIDAQVIRQNAEREAWGYRAGSTLDRYSASQQSPLLASGGTLLNGVSSVAGKWYGFKQSGAI
jgi:hypothetical protein